MLVSENCARERMLVLSESDLNLVSCKLHFRESVPDLPCLYGPHFGFSWSATANCLIVISLSSNFNGYLLTDKVTGNRRELPPQAYWVRRKWRYDVSRQPVEIVSVKSDEFCSSNDCRATTSRKSVAGAQSRCLSGSAGTSGVSIWCKRPNMPQEGQWKKSTC